MSKTRPTNPVVDAVALKPCERNALQEALRENIALRCLLGGGCDANNDGPHEVYVRDGKDRFCTECGEMLDAKGRSKPWFHGGRLERAKARLTANPRQSADAALVEALEVFKANRAAWLSLNTPEADIVLNALALAKATGQ